MAETYNGWGQEMEVLATYDSRRRNVDGPLGWGWRHNLDISLQEFADSNGLVTTVVYTEGSGRRNAFHAVVPGAGGFQAIPGRAMNLTRHDGLYVLRFGDGTLYEFNENMQLATRTDRRGLTARYEYENDKLTRFYTSYGRCIKLSYNGAGRVQEIIDPDGHSTTFDYDPAGHLLEIVDPAGNPVTYTYDTNTHWIESETLRNGVTYTAYHSWNSRELRDNLGNTISYLTSAAGFPDLQTDDVSPGNVVWTDGNGNDWVFRRDGYGRIREERSPDSGPITYYEYGTPYDGDNYQRLVEVRDGRGNSTYYNWTAQGRIADQTDALGNTTSYTYSADASYQLQSVVDADGDAWVYDFNSNGDWISTTDPLLNTIQIDFEDYGELFQVGSNGLPLPGRIHYTTITDRNGNITVYEYDPRGNLVTETRGAGDLNLTTSYTHDDSGRMLSTVVDRGDQDIVVNVDRDVRGWKSRVWSDGGADGVIENVYRYDDLGNLIEYVNPRGVDMDLTYDHRNRLTDVLVDSNGLALTYEFTLDGNGNTVEAIDANTNATSNGYSARNLLSSFTDASGTRTLLDRDENGNLTSVRRSMNGDQGPYYTVLFEYDELDRVTEKRVDGDIEDLVTTVEYATAGCGCGGTTGTAIPSKITLPGGTYTEYEYDALDRLTQVLSGDSIPRLAERFYYDAGGRLAKSIQNPNGLPETQEYFYDAADRVTETRAFDWPAQPRLITTFEYDGADNVTTIELPNGNIVEREFDYFNRLVQAEDVLGLIGRYGYDVNGNITTYENATTNAWAFSYDNLDRLTSVIDPVGVLDSLATQYQYDGNSNLVRRIDKNGVETAYEYDPLDRLERTIRNSRPVTIYKVDNVTTSYDRDALGRITGMVDPDGNTTSYTYDDLGRLIQIAYPDADTSGLDIVSFAYELDPNTVTRTDQAGISTKVFLDWRGDVRRRTVSQGAATLIDQNFEHDRIGRLTSASDGVNTTTWLYDPLGRPGIVEQTQGSQSFETYIYYTVEPEEKRSTRRIAYPGGREVIETYDARGRLGKLVGGADVGGYTDFDAANRPISAELLNGVISSFSYDALGRPESIGHFLGGQTLYKVGFGYDAVGNRKFMRDYVNTDRSEFYLHDPLNRLATMTRGVLAADNSAIETPLDSDALDRLQNWPAIAPLMGLERRGNWQTFHQGRGTDPNHFERRTFNAANEYETIDPDAGGPQDPVELAYDAVGRLVNDPTAPNVGDVSTNGQRYVYDALGKLTATWRTNGTADPADDDLLLEVAYDAIGRRIESIEYIDANTGGLLAAPVRTWHIYDGLNPIEEYNVTTNGVGGETATLAREFVFGAGGFPNPVAMIDHTDAGEESAAVPEVLHYLHTALGSIVGLTNSNGEMVERYTYDPYGTTHIERPDGQGGWTFTGSNGVAWTASSYGNPWMFTGQRYDATTQQYHFWARTYSPRLGRWLQRDPMGYVDGVSLYQYVISSPLVLVDPLGLGFWSWVLGVDTERAGVREEFWNEKTVTWEVEQAGRDAFAMSNNDRTQGTLDAAGSWASQGLISNAGDLLGTETFDQKTRAEACGLARTIIETAENVNMVHGLGKQLVGHFGRNMVKGVSGFADDAAEGLGRRTVREGGEGSLAHASDVDDGVIYLRRDGKGGEYVGQAKNNDRFMQRQAEHHAANPGEKYDFEVLETVPKGSGRSLDVAEEDWIRAGGGPQSTGGRLQNSRHQMSEGRYRQAGGEIDYP